MIVLVYYRTGTVRCLKKTEKFEEEQQDESGRHDHDYGSSEINNTLIEFLSAYCASNSSIEYECVSPGSRGNVGPSVLRVRRGSPFTDRGLL
jgi:hypothetical protein